MLSLINGLSVFILLSFDQSNSFNNCSCVLQ